MASIADLPYDIPIEVFLEYALNAPCTKPEE
jgi:hypothetical protein